MSTALPEPREENPHVEGDTALQSGVLEDLSEAVNYRRWLVELGAPHLGDDAIEIGSGTGDYAAEWADMGVRITASEADPARLAQLRERFEGDGRITVEEMTVPLSVDAEHSAVVAYNVLEHIPDDVGALRDFRRLLRPGGAVVLIVPAFPFAFSRFDAAIGHQRRYTKASLRAAVEGAGLRVEQLRYVNSLGLLTWVVAMKLLRMTPGAGAHLTAWDRVAVPVVRWLESHITPPFGQSVLVVARSD